MNGRGCYFCGEQLIWMHDYSLDEVLGEGDGIGTLLQCSGCGAEVEYITGRSE